MIELVFSDSACGSLKMAQHHGVGKHASGCVGVIVSHADDSKATKSEMKAAMREAEARSRLAWGKGAAMGGNTDDVFGIHFALSVGDIAQNDASTGRLRAIEQLYSIYPNEEGHEWVQPLLKQATENLEAVHRRMALGEAVRIWYSNQPDEMCGLYWFMSQLVQWEISDAKVVAVRLPEWEETDSGAVQKIGWGGVAPGDWHSYLALQQPISPLRMRSYAAHWQVLQHENAPLRAVLNGQLVSAPETLYDDFILREIAVEGDEFHEANIVGRVLGKYQLGIGDAWIALRIEKMIAAGKLKAITTATEDMPIYHRMLKKCE